MSNFTQRLFGWLVTQRRKVLVLSLLLTLLSLLPIQQVYFLQSQEMWLPKGGDTLNEFNQIRNWFGSNQYLLVGLSSDDSVHPVFNPATLMAIKEITNFLDGHELVVKVSSLSNHQYMESSAGSLWLKDFVTKQDYKRSGSDLALILKERIQQDPLVSPRVINQEGREARISALITYRESEVTHHVKIVQDLRNFIAEKGYGEKGITLHFSGFPFISANTALDNMKDQSILLPALLLLLILMLRLVLGRWAYVWLPLTLATCTTLITIGFMGAIGFPLTMLNASLPLIIIAMSVVDAVHLINRHNRELQKGENATEAAITTGVNLWRPCWFTTLTTMLGFMALSFSDMAPVREYGIAAAFAILVAYILSITFLIAWLSYLRKPAKTCGFIQNIPLVTAKFADLGLKHRIPLIVSTVMLVVSGGWLASQLTADANYLRFFRADSPVTQGLHYFDERFNGANNLEIAVDSRKDDGVLEPEFLHRVAELQLALNKLSGVGQTQSLLDYLTNLHRVFTGSIELPTTRAQAAQYLFLYASNDPIEDLTDLRSFDGRYLRLSLPVKNQDASGMSDLLSQVQQLIQDQFPDLSITMSGDLYIQHKTEYYIQQNLVQSFSLALGAILLCLLVVFRSLRYGLLALLPAVLPLLIAAALMSLFKVYLDFGTMIVAAITIGIAVDDTIHIMNDYLSARRSGLHPAASIRNAMDHAGTAVVATSVILWCAFFVMSFSHFMPNVYFGIFAGVIIAGALLSNLLILPALLAITQREQIPSETPSLAKES